MGVKPERYRTLTVADFSVSETLVNNQKLKAMAPWNQGPRKTPPIADILKNFPQSVSAFSDHYNANQRTNEGTHLYQRHNITTHQIIHFSGLTGPLSWTTQLYITTAQQTKQV
jgi:hypothetical protein